MVLQGFFLTKLAVFGLRVPQSPFSETVQLALWDLVLAKGGVGDVSPRLSRVLGCSQLSSLLFTHVSGLSSLSLLIWWSPPTLSLKGHCGLGKFGGNITPFSSRGPSGPSSWAR